jgi:O-methyltransferase involved in polyketide biosynthesis
MATQEGYSSIADASKPNAGRIYDYLLGGNHNFEVDRQAAQRFLKTMPFMPKFMRTVRWFLGEAVHRLVEEGFHHFLDFASGLPTMDHIHHIAPKGTKIIYSDLDPVTVAYGQEILKNNPDVRFVQCDAGKAEELLNAPIVSELFGKTRKIAIGFNGIAWFLPDEKVKHSLKVLYDWVDKGSRLFMAESDSAVQSDLLKTLMKIYQEIGQPFYFRTQQKFKENMGSWEITEPGIQPLEDWLSIKKEVDSELWKNFSGNAFGAILVKK